VKLFLPTCISILALGFATPSSARADILTSCLTCNGDRFAITFQLESNDGITSVYDVTLLADTSGDSLGGTHYIDAVAIGLSGITVETAMQAAPNGATNWTGQGGGLNGSGCSGTGAFICASANSSSFEALAPNASTATTPYAWTWNVDVPDSTQGGAASVFSSSSVKIHYSDVPGVVAGSFTFLAGPASTIPEPASILLLGTVLCASGRLLRKKLTS
jgi:hypothetical protein